MKTLSTLCILLLSTCVFSQEKITDMESGITYLTDLHHINGNPAFEENPTKIIGTDQAALALMNNPQAIKNIGGYLYRGPSERIPTGPFGEDGMSIKICHNTNIWPCMWVSKSRS